MNLILTAWMAIMSLFVGPSIQPKVEIAKPTSQLNPIDRTLPDSLSSAASLQVTDLTTGNTIYSRNVDQRRSMASLTKLMTAFLILKRHQLDELVTIPADIKSLDGTNSQSIGLVPGDSLTVEQALQALLIYSANDAAVGLAAWDAGSQSAFVVRMNDAARDLGLANTQFTNASGLDSDGHYSTAADLTKLARSVLTSDVLRGIVKTKSKTITSKQSRNYRLMTTNNLLADPLVKGLKTGYTSQAGECLITYDTDQAGHQLLTVLLGSTDRFGESSRMVHYLLD